MQISAFEFRQDFLRFLNMLRELGFVCSRKFFDPRLPNRNRRPTPTDFVRGFTGAEGFASIAWTKGDAVRAKFLVTILGLEEVMTSTSLHATLASDKQYG